MPKFTPARRMGRDQETDIAEELHRMIDDPEASLGDVIAAVVEAAGDDPDKQVEINQALSDVAEDRRRGRSPRQWAADRRERRLAARDGRARRARDNPPAFEGRPNPGGELDPLARREGEDRRRMAGDMAYDNNNSLEAFHRRFPTLRGRVPERF